MQLQFLAAVELFFNGQKPVRIFFFDLQFFLLCEIRPKAENV